MLDFLFITKCCHYHCFKSGQNFHNFIYFFCNSDRLKNQCDDGKEQIGSVFSSFFHSLFKFHTPE